MLPGSGASLVIEDSTGASARRRVVSSCNALQLIPFVVIIIIKKALMATLYAALHAI